MKKSAVSTPEGATTTTKNGKISLFEIFAALDPARQKAAIFVLAHAVEAMKESPQISFEEALKKGVHELSTVIQRTKEHEAKALRILRGKRRLPASRGMNTFLG